MSMSLCIGLIPFEVAPTVMTLLRHQVTSVVLIAAGKAEARTRRQLHLELSPSEQYRRHIQEGGYRP